MKKYVVDKKVVSMSGSEVSVYEHSAAISNIYVDTEELITDDYDGIVIFRLIEKHIYVRVFRNVRVGSNH